MALDAIIFDLDGTLLNTNPVHVEAWRRAFEKFGFIVAPDRIAVEIARDAQQMIASVLGRSIADAQGEEIAEAVSDFVPKVIAERKPLPVLKGARELFAALKKRGLKTALATTAGDEELDALIEGSGFDVRELCNVVTTKDAVENAKPAPDILWAACAELEVNPAQCVFVGDTKWDALCAREAGVVAVGILEGSAFSREELSQSGMRIVFDTLAELVENLDDVLEKCAPGVLQMTRGVQEDLMRQAIAVAREGMEDGGAPIGCVIARPKSESEFEIIARGFNEGHRAGDKTAHAEIVTFRKVAGKVPTDATDVILVSTLEPCVMCLGAAMESAVDTIVYGLRAPADNGTTRLSAPQSPETTMPRIIGGILSDDCRALFEEWLEKNKGSEQAAFVEQLMELTEKAGG